MKKKVSNRLISKKHMKHLKSFLAGAGAVGSVYLGAYLTKPLKKYIDDKKKLNNQDKGIGMAVNRADIVNRGFQRDKELRWLEGISERFRI
jgi:predicted patatin/cPLA2 family phospholipase